LPYFLSQKKNSQRNHQKPSIINVEYLINTKFISLMNNQLKISIIIPVFNEEKRIPRCLERILEYCNEKEWDYEVLVAEDGSTDNTVKIVNDFASQENRFKLLSFPDRLGKGGAIKNAMFHATKDYVCFMDVDLSADVAELERLIPYVNDYEIIIGSRILRGNLPPIKSPLFRKISSRFYSKFFRLLFRMPIKDPQCGFKLFKKNIVSRLFKNVHTTNFAFDSEVLVKAYWSGLKIKEVPIIWKFDPATKISVFKQVREMGNSLMQIWYESHLMWLQNQPTYPQKRGSIQARMVFSILSTFMKARK